MERSRDGMRNLRRCFTLTLFFWLLATALGQEPDAAAILAGAETLREKGDAASLRQSLEKYQQALPLYRTAGDRQGQAKTLYGVAQACDALSDKRKALDSYQQALALFNATGDHGRDALILIYIALDQDYLADREHARASVVSALAALESGTGSAQRGEVLSHAGQVYNDLGDRAKALEC